MQRIGGDWIDHKRIYMSVEQAEPAVGDDLALDPEGAAHRHRIRRIVQHFPDDIGLVSRHQEGGKTEVGAQRLKGPDISLYHARLTISCNCHCIRHPIGNIVRIYYAERSHAISIRPQLRLPEGAVTETAPDCAPGHWCFGRREIGSILLPN